MSAFDSDTPPRDVPCMACRAPVELSGFAWDLAKTFNHALYARNEPLLESHELTRCEPCGLAWKAKRLAQFEKMCAYVNELQSKAKAGALIPATEIAELRRQGFRDWGDGLEMAMARARGAVSPQDKAKHKRGAR